MKQSIFIPYASVFSSTRVLFWLVFFFLSFFLSSCWFFFSFNRESFFNDQCFAPSLSLSRSLHINRRRKKEKVLFASIRHCSDRFSIGNHSVIGAVNVSRHSFFSPSLSSLSLSTMTNQSKKYLSAFLLSIVFVCQDCGLSLVKKKEMRREQEKMRCDSPHTGKGREAEGKAFLLLRFFSSLFLFHHRVNLAAIIIVLITELRKEAVTR